MTTNLDQRLREHLAYAYEHAPAVKGLFERAGLTLEAIQSVADLPKLPVTSKDQLTAMQQQDPPFGGWLGVAPSSLDRIYLSPGPIYDPFSMEDKALADDAIDALKQVGFSAGDVVINAFLYHMVPAGLLLDEVVRRTGATVVPLGPGNTDVHVKVMLDLKANGYVGTPSFLAIVLDKAEEMGLPREAVTLQKAFFTAEPYPPSLRARFEEDYGLKTSQAYGTADLGVIAYEVPGAEGMVLAANQVVELVDPESGQRVEEGTPGEVVVTKFDRTYPLVRFGTGDMAIAIPGTNRLLALVGRSGEAVKVRGMFLHPNQLKFVHSMFTGLQALQAVISREGARDIVTVRVVKAPEGQVEDDQLKAALQQAARLNVNAIEWVDTLEDSRLIVDQRTWD
ncbi:MAG: phenylacetate--CoA ligase [Chloroflexi bacterium]|nr:phenylacetate--CoA ligase [Chloroflexota bacterium]